MAALHLAFDAGVTYYDVARSYGFGEAESIVGAFLRGRRDRVIVATKFGIMPPPRARLLSYLKPLVRTAVRVIPSLRAAAASAVASAVKRGDFSPAAARKSLDESLRALRTDYVDVLLLHSCGVDDALREDLLALLDDCRRRGLVRAYGLATDLPTINEVLAATPSYRIVQFIDGLLHPAERRSVRCDLEVTHGALRGYANQSQNVVDRIHRAFIHIGLPRPTPSDVVHMLVSQAFHRNKNGVVLMSMATTDHLADNIRVLDERPFDEERIRSFAAYFQAESPILKPNN